MAYFPDLTPYTYFGGLLNKGYLNVGWLDKSEPFPVGVVSEKFIKVLQTWPTAMHTRGWHTCPFCAGAQGDCELRVIYDGKAYAAPILIRHYISEHQYKPPDEFIEAIMKGLPIVEYHGEVLRF